VKSTNLHISGNITKSAFDDGNIFFYCTHSDWVSTDNPCVHIHKDDLNPADLRKLADYLERGENANKNSTD
jgi:hypothetical protein